MKRFVIVFFFFCEIVYGQTVSLTDAKSCASNLTNTLISVGIMVVALALFALFIFRKSRKSKSS